MSLLHHIQSAPLRELETLVTDLEKALEALDQSESLKQRLKKLILKESLLYEAPEERAMQLLHRALQSLHDMKDFFEREEEKLIELIRQRPAPELQVLKALQQSLREEVTAKHAELMLLKKSLG